MNNDEMNEMLVEAMIPQIVSRLARAAVKLGGDAEDTNGAVKALCQRAGLDVFAWYCVRREIADMQHKARRIGFIR